MATSTINEYTLPKNSYAAFDAISLRNLIIQRLNDQGTFTDQNYIGSNLSSIIDIISYSYNTLLFYLNRTSTESTFTEAQLYENITRIVKLLDYKPIGYQTSTLVFDVSASSLLSTDITFDDTKHLAVGQSYTISRYSYLLIGGVPFSFNEDITFSTKEEGVVKLDDISNKKLLYQGVYKENPIYTAQGDSNEITTIINSTALIDHFNVDVYVYETNAERWVQYKNVPNLYTERPYSRVFEKRLNAERLYEISFGDGINGRKLESGDLVAIYYLESNGEAGVVGPYSLSEVNKIIFSTSTFAQILDSTNAENFNYINTSKFEQFTFNNVVGSTVPKDIETTESIRKNAPANFKSQYRLVTKEDYDTFIRTNFANFVSDVKIFSNWDYTGKYLKYFNDMMVSPTSFRQIALNQVLYSDSCNFNNIYVCAIPKISPKSTLKYLLPAQKEAILSNVSSLKTLTSEIVFMDPIYKAVSLGVKINDEVLVTDRDFCKLEIIKSSTSRRSSRSIANDVRIAFETFFNPMNIKLGQRLEYSSLVSSILSIEGVSKIKTKRIDTNEYFEGLSLYMWNPVYPDLDKTTIVNDTEMQEFDFFYFDGLLDIFSKIEVTEDLTFIQ